VPGPQGPAGPTGAVGDKGATGATGATGSIGGVIVRRHNGDAGSNALVTVSCLANETAVGGGGNSSNPATPLTQSVPLVGTAPAAEGQTPDGWGAAANNGTGEVTTVYVLCAS
jgi:hypothetical protein